MHIEEIEEEEVEGSRKEEISYGDCGNNILTILNVKRVFAGVGARTLFYPTLLYNVLRNKIQPTFRW